MLKKIIGVVSILAILYSCGSKQKETGCTSEKISVQELMDSIDNYIDKNVLVYGTVSHVCSHGGKRMFLIAENPDVAIKVTPNDEIGVFSKELEGSTVHVFGKAKELRIDDAYITDMEKEMLEGVENEASHTHDGNHDGEHKTELDSTQIEKLAQMRQEVVESGKGYISQYWIEATKVETADCAAKSDAEHKCTEHKADTTIESEK
ncbi:MAG: hypothetical protein AB7S50_00485 [Bacteroidales bacterium]